MELASIISGTKMNNAFVKIFLDIQKPILIMALFLVCAGEVMAGPINLPNPIIDQKAPYLQSVRIITSLRDQGYLTPSLVSTQMALSLEQSIGILRASRRGSTIQPLTVSRNLEENWIWWAESDGAPMAGGRSYPISFFIHNRSDAVVSGIIVELADRDCDFRPSALKAFHIISFGPQNALRPNDGALFESSIPTRSGMFATSGGLWCMTIVRAF